jgi:hypothetical protein
MFQHWIYFINFIEYPILIFTAKWFYNIFILRWNSYDVLTVLLPCDSIQYPNLLD